MLQVLGMNGFCATCHKSYFTNSGSAHRNNSLNTPVNTVGPGTPTVYPSYPYPGTQDSNDGNGNVPRYRHAVVKNRSITSYPKQPLRFAALGIDPNPPSSSVYGRDAGVGSNAQVQYRAFGLSVVPLRAPVPAQLRLRRLAPRQRGRRATAPCCSGATEVSASRATRQSAA
jgi:hypothetical protein